MKHVDIRKIFAPALYDVLAHAEQLPKIPRPYQRDALTKIADWASDLSGTKRAYLQHATGLGKTILFATAVHASHELRSLIIVPSRPLLVQTARTVAKYTHGILGHLSSVGNISDHEGDLIAVRGLDHSSVVIVTDDSFNKYATQILSDLDPHIILRDECHWGYTDDAITNLNLFEESLIIGFSATPDCLTNKRRGGFTPVTLDNGQVLYGPRDKFAETHFQTCLDRLGLKWGIEEGWLAPLEWGMIDFEQITLKDVPIVETKLGPDYDKSKLQAMLEAHWSVMCETIRRLYENGEMDLPNKQVYAVCPSVKAAYQLSETIASMGYSTACVTGDTKPTERDVIFDAYREKDIRFLSSVKVLREGWDDPYAEVCMMLTPTKSYQNYMQPIGRCVRLPDDGSPKTSLVLDAHFQGKDFSPMSLPALFAPPGSELPMLGGGNGPGGGGWSKFSLTAVELPEGAKPKIIVVEDYMQIQEDEQANNLGILLAEGEEWICLRTMAKQLKVTPGTISQRLRKHPCRKRDGKTRKGQNVFFYALRDLREICNDLIHAIEQFPEAEGDGIYREKGKPWITIKRAQKELGIGEPAIIARLVTTPCRNKQVRLKGTVITVFALEDLRAACNDLLDPDLIPLNRDGIGTVSGIAWYILKALAKRFGSINGPVKSRLDAGACTTKKGRLRSGQLVDCYPLKEATALCKDLIDRVSLPRAIDGSFSADGEVWVDLEPLAKWFGLSRPTVRIRLANSDCRTRIGVSDKNGREYMYYALLDAERVLFDPRIKKLPRADQTGGFILEEIEWAPINTLAKRWSIAFAAIQRRIRPDNCRMREGLTACGQIVTFFAVEDVYRAVQDVLEHPRGPRPKRKKK